MVLAELQLGNGDRKLVRVRIVVAFTLAEKIESAGEELHQAELPYKHSAKPAVINSVLLPELVRCLHNSH